MKGDVFVKYNFLNSFIKYLSLCLLTASILVCTSTLPTQSFADTQSDYDENNKELDRLKSEQAALSSELTDLNNELEVAGNKLNSITEQISAKQEDIDILNENISDMEEEKQHQYETMKLRIQFMYERNDFNFIDVLLTSTSMSDLLQKAEYFKQISEYDKDMLNELNDLINSLNSNRINLQKDMNDLVALKEDSIAQSNNIKNLISSKQSKIDANSQDIERAEALALEYEEKLRQEEAARQLEEIKKLTSTDEVINNTPINYDASDLAMMAAMIECEAGNQSYEGKLAVGSVIVNRVNSPRFGNTIQSVLYAPYQFTPVASGRFAIVLARGANAECTKAAAEVLSGHITINALYFHMYDSSVDSGGTIIGDHVFY